MKTKNQLRAEIVEKNYANKNIHSLRLILYLSDLFYRMHHPIFYRTVTSEEYALFQVIRDSMESGKKIYVIRDWAKEQRG